MHVQQATDVDYIIQQKADCAWVFLWQFFVSESFFLVCYACHFLNYRGYLEFCIFLKYNIMNTFMATLNFLDFFLKIHFLSPDNENISATQEFI